MSNSVCFCCALTADKICLCTYPPTPIADGCRNRHEEKSKSLSHTYWPIAWLIKVASPEVLDEGRNREDYFKRAKRRLMQQAEEIDACIAAVIQTFGDVLAYVTEVQAKRVGELYRQKEEMMKVLEDTFGVINEHLLDPEFEPEELLMSQVWNRQEVTFQQFKYSVKPTQPIFDLISDLVLITWCSLQPATPVHLAYISNDVLKTLSTPSQTWNSLRLSQHADLSLSSSLAFLNKSSLFACGDNPAHSSAYAITVKNGAVRTLASLRCKRYLPGVAVVGTETFVFCGKDERGMPINVCEKLTNLTSAWMQLPNSHYKRWCFNPCSHRDLVYLIGGNPQNGPESFNVGTSEFTKLASSFNLQNGQGLSTSVVVGEDLLVINKNVVHVWKLNSQETECRTQVVEGLPDTPGVSGSLLPFVSDGQMYVLQGYAKQLHQIDLATYRCTVLPFN